MFQDLSALVHQQAAMIDKQNIMIEEKHNKVKVYRDLLGQSRNDSF